jgi:hypothetical protein
LVIARYSLLNFKNKGIEGRALQNDLKMVRASVPLSQTLIAAYQRREKAPFAKSEKG